MTLPDQDVPADPPRPPDADQQVVPPVVVVLVVDDPGAWFEETLESVAAQTYANASVLVVDVGSDETTAARVAAVLPDAHQRRLPGNPGFGAAANEVMRAVEGAAFFLVCHDDVRLDRDALQVMVEEAFRSNAGIVGPKLVDWTDDRHLLSVGMGTDRLGYPSPYVERGELDQSQHDAVRDAFYVPGAATLVRADLFEALHGFDEEITFHGDDLDLCWRAHVAGARVVVAPEARVAHLEALGVRRPVDDRRRLQARHRLRAMRVSNTRWTRLRAVPYAALISAMEVLYSVVLGRFRQARDVWGAWTWNIRHRGGIRRQRKALDGVRRVPDRDVRALQARGSARLSAFLRGQIGSTEDRILTISRTRDVTERLRSSKARTAFVAWLLIGTALVVGSRDLLFGSIAAIGNIPVLGDSATDLVRGWASGYRAVGLGSVEPNPTGLGFIGALGLVFLGALSLLTKVLVLGMLPLGAAGMWRLTKALGSRRSRIVALVVYVAVPVPYNAVAAGDWNALVTYALAPWLLGQLAKASGLSPFGPLGGDAGPGVRTRPLLQRVVAVGVLTALGAMASGALMLLTPALAVALVVGGALGGTTRGAGRVLVVAAGGTVVAGALQLPWTLGLLDGSWQALVGNRSGATALDLGDILRFDTGPLGSGPLSYLFLVAAALPLLIGRAWRITWAVRAWTLILGSFAIVFAQSQGWLGGDLPSADALIVPAAAGVALASAMGMAAFEVDLPDYHFGWRQILSVLAGAALALAVLPALGATADGRWDMPEGDYARALAFVDAEDDQPFRVLWMGEPSVLPLASWPLAEEAYGTDPTGSGYAFATSDDGTATLEDRWPAPSSDGTDQLAAALDVAGSGGTSRLGALLAPMGVRYVVVPRGPAPEPEPPTTQPDTILATLAAQLDLSPVTTAGVVLYRNDAWGPTRAQLPPGTEVPGGDVALASRTLPELAGAPVALPDEQGPQDFEGALDTPADVYLAEAAADEWRLEVDGTAVPREDAFGWSNVFRSEATGTASLRFDTPTSRYLALAVQALLWVAAVVFLLRVRVVTDERRALPSDDGEDPR